MKRNTLLLCAIAALMTSSCDDKTVTCADLLVDVTNTASDWDASDADCAAYRDAMQAYIDSDCGYADQLDEYEAIIDTLPCP